MRVSLSKKSKKVIEEGLGELKQRSSLAELTRIGARMMLEVAVEEELTTFLGRDYYERRTGQGGSRSGSKPRTIKVGCGDIEVNMPMVRDAGGPFHSEELSGGEKKDRWDWEIQARGLRDEERALTMVYWQMKELRWYGVDMTKEARAILAGGL